MASTTAAESSSKMKKSPNWLEMPHELMTNIFQRLRTSEILNSERKVCTTWRTICNDPTIWKVIEIHKWQDGCNTDYYMGMLIMQAVDLSRGGLIDITIEGFCTDDILDHIVLSSSKLKRLSLLGCYDITGSSLSKAVKKVPQLEELHLSGICINGFHIEFIGRNCPQLKSLKISNMMFCWQYVDCDDQAVAIAKYMPELRHLQISGEEMTNDGFHALLNGCPHLESLHIHMFDSFFLDGNLVKLCTERIKDFKHNSKQENDNSYEIPVEEYGLI